MAEENIQVEESQVASEVSTVTETKKAETKVAVAKESGKVTAKESGKVAVVLVRGLVKVRQTIKQTIWNLGLRRVNQCVVLDMNDSTLGMLRKAKDYITWGKISEAEFKEIVNSRGEEYKGRETDSKGKYKYNFIEVSGKKYKKVFRLNPPRKGFGRAGIKRGFSSGGALGDRNDKMGELVKRML